MKLPCSCKRAIVLSGIKTWKDNEAALRRDALLRAYLLLQQEDTPANKQAYRELAAKKV